MIVLKWKMAYNVSNTLVLLWVYFMAIKSSTFSGWRLSGQDAEAFLKQISETTPNPQAKAAVLRGRASAKEYIAKGYVTFSSSKPVKTSPQ